MNRRRLLTLLGAGALHWPSLARGQSDEPLISPENARADFEAMYRGLQAAHFDLYAFTPKARLDAAFRAQLADFDRPMSLFEVQRRLQLFCARVRSGHTRVDYLPPAWTRYRKAGGKGLPLEIRIIQGRVFVAANHSGVATIEVGDEILALNGRPIRRWLDRTARNVSAETDYMAWSLLEFDFPALVWLEAGPLDAFEVETRRGGRRQRLGIPAVTAKEAEVHAGPKPAFDPFTPEARMLPGGVGYLRPGPFYNAQAQTEAEASDTTGFIAFVDAAFRDFNRHGARKALIDLRGNPGGDNAFSDPMIAWFADRPFRFFSEFKVKVSPQAVAANRARLAAGAAAAGAVSRQYAGLYAGARMGEVVDFELPLHPGREGERFPGQVFLLVDRQSYSNAVNVAATVQDYRFGTILGEETGDVATIHGAMERFTLPRTGVAVGFPKAYIVRPSGDRRSRGVRPDIVIPAPIASGPDDPMLAAALAAIARR